jgi:mannose/fructose/N-acetylgalactosamine-specific phosphotransferase system component IID
VRRSLLKAAGRSFMIQAGWNFDRMQNLGFAWSMLPPLREIYPDKERRTEALLRHMDLVNTHPFMAPLLMGSVIRAEQEGSHAGAAAAAQRTATLKQALCGPLAAIGDSLFWATLRPLAALAAVSVAWMAPELGPVAPMATFLGLFNLPHLVIRFNGIFQGYTLGSSVSEYLRRTDTQGVIAAFRLAAMILVGSTLAGFGRFEHLASHDPMPFKDNFLFIGAGLFMLMGLRLKFSVNKLFVGACLAALLFSVVFPDSNNH